MKALVSFIVNSR